MLFAAESHVGLVRQTNQDVFELGNIPAAYQFMIVADGMGGASAGEVASKIAADTVAEDLTKIFLGYNADGGGMENHEPVDEPVNDFVSSEAGTTEVNGAVSTGIGQNGDAVEVLRETVLKANQKVWDSSRTHEEYFGMGTTLVAAVLSERQVLFAHVGDSRGYILTEQGLKQVTSDHSLVAELVRRGQLTPAEAVHHPQRNIVTRSLGTARESIVDIDVLEWQQGDAVLLCTDGLSNLVSDQELETLLAPLHTAQSENEVQDVAAQLLQLAIKRGAPDNVTLTIAVHNGMRSEDA